MQIAHSDNSSSFIDFIIFYPMFLEFYLFSVKRNEFALSLKLLSRLRAGGPPIRAALAAKNSGSLLNSYKFASYALLSSKVPLSFTFLSLII